MTKLRATLLTILLSGCASLPPFPEVLQCGYSGKFGKFRCCNTNTKQCSDVHLDDPVMEGAQCLSPDDYKKASAWVESVKQIANEHCH